MDLQTIKQKLASNSYDSVDACFADVQLIWDNCKLYNMAGSDIYRICERMERAARRELNKYRQQQGMPLQSAPVGVQKRLVKNTILDAAIEPQEVTVDMKMEFCSKIKKLPVDALSKFVEYIS